MTDPPIDLVQEQEQHQHQNESQPLNQLQLGPQSENGSDGSPPPSGTLPTNGDMGAAAAAATTAATNDGTAHVEAPSIIQGTGCDPIIANTSGSGSKLQTLVDTAVPDFFPSQKFATIQDLVLAIERHAHERGFRFAKSFTYINGTKIVHRGKFKCQRYKRGHKDVKGTATTTDSSDVTAPSAMVPGDGNTDATTSANVVTTVDGNDDSVHAAATIAAATVPPKPHIACDFVVTFSGMISRGAHYPACYVIKTVNLDHGHELDPPLLLPSTTTAKTSLLELTTDELNVLRESHKHDAIRLAQILHGKYGFDYSITLIEEARTQVLEELYGDTREGLRKFLEFGYRTSASGAEGGTGGKFFTMHKHDLTFEAAAYQSPDMLAIHRAYRDHIIQDGALVTNVLGLSLIPTLVVDGLGKIAISSIVVAPIESSHQPLEAVLNGIDFFGRIDDDNDVRITYTTNRTPAFDKVARKFGLQHIININAQLGDIDQNLAVDAMARNLFRRLCYDVLTATDDQAQVQKELADLKVRYQNNPEIIKHVLELEANQTKLCRAYTGVYFTGGSYAPAGASAGSVVKEMLALSKELKKKNIFELAIDLNDRFADYKARTLKELSGLIKQKEEWSNIVASHWKTEVAESGKFKARERIQEDKGLSFVVSRLVSEVSGQSTATDLLSPSDAGPAASMPTDESADDNTITTASAMNHVEKTHLVRLPEDGAGIPTCDCMSFLSTQMPCRHICSVLLSQGESNPCQLKYLAHRWRLENHPFYLEASQEEWALPHLYQRGDIGITGVVAAAAVAGMGEHYAKRRKIET